MVKRVYNAFKETAVGFLKDLKDNWKGLTLLSLATIGGATLLTGWGISTASSLMLASGGIYAISI